APSDPRAAELFDAGRILDGPPTGSQAHRHRQRTAQAVHARIDGFGLEPAGELVERLFGKQLVTEGLEEPAMDLFEVDPVTNRADVGDRAELLRQRVGESHYEPGPSA